MNIKKILLSLVAGAVVAGAMSFAALAAGDTDEAGAVAKIGDEYYSTIEKAMADSADGEKIVIVKDVNNIPAPTKAGLYFKAADGVKVTSRVNPPRFNAIDGVVTYEGFDFTTYDSGNGLFACFDGGHQLEGLEVVFKNCIFGGEKSIGIWGWATATAAESITLDGCEIADGSKFYFTFGKVNNIVLKNCDFSNYSAGGTIVQMPEYAGNITVTNCDFGNGFINFAPNQGDFERSIVIEDSVFNGEKAVNLHSNFTNSSIDFAEVTFVENTLGGITSAFMVAEGVDFQNVFEDAVVTFEDNATADGAEVEDFIVPAKAVAKIGNTFYAPLEAAIKAATNGATIDLLGNVIEITVSKDNYDASKNLTFENGTFDLTYAGAGTAFFWLTGSETLTFNNVDFVKRDIGLDAKFMCYLFNVESANNVLSFNNCNFDLDGKYIEPQWPGHGLWSSVIANNAGGKIFLTNCNIENEYNNFVYMGGATITNCTYDGYADLDEGDVAGNILNHDAYGSVIENSKINTRLLSVAKGNVSIVNSEIIATTARSTSTGKITVDANSSLKAETISSGAIDEENSAGTIVSKADTIEVVFEKVDEEEVNGVMVDNAEGEDLYNINLVGKDAETINRLNSADLTFKLTSDHDMAFTIVDIAEDNIVVNPVNNSDDRYEFHFETKTNVENDTANTITIAQVKFEGYGEYDFVIVDNDTNAVHATTIADNIVDTFIPGGAAEGKGELVIEDVIDAYIAVPTRNLIINIDFPNSVEEQKIAYNNMKVVVSGGDLAKEIEVKLGADAVETEIDTENDKADAKYVADFVDGAYVVKITDVLTVNNSYNVEVSGAGYRTARYTVTMNCEESKTLNFWNNVKDNAIEVEVGKETSEKNVTFLAGDIVKDSVINIYDLSAVVSYFGEIMNVTAEHPYAKYDLNRDGKIDSKDVAYVLVSWNN